MQYSIPPPPTDSSKRPSYISYNESFARSLFRWSPTLSKRMAWRSVITLQFVKSTFVWGGVGMEDLHYFSSKSAISVERDWWRKSIFKCDLRTRMFFWFRRGFRELIFPSPRKYVSIFISQLFILYGGSGCGKTSLMAKAYMTSLANWKESEECR